MIKESNFEEEQETNQTEKVEETKEIWKKQKFGGG